jgi:superfamily II DNA or RNA helicase
MKKIKRRVSLRPYQKECSDYILKSNKCVLALCPNGGKTEISIDVIERYLKLFPKNKVLVLTHSTNVLLNNFYERLESLDVSFSYSNTFESNASVHLCIPANQHKLKGNYDFIIVDEAHENYMATRVQEIIEKTNPSKQLMLTGTPSKFVFEGGYDIFAIALDELDEKYFAKLNLECVASNYNLQNSDYNAEEDVKDTFNYTQEDTDKTLETVVFSILNRLDSGLTAEQYNDPSLFSKAKLYLKSLRGKYRTWDDAFKSVGKTLIVCNNIAQANLVQKSLIKKGVNSVCSHSLCDKNCDLINNFKNDEHDVLVVVDRCRIGYDDAKMMNLIDMSGTRNINLIYQMMCRVIRGDQSVTKFYLKVTTNDMVQMAADEIAVNGAIMLSNKEFLLKFNGKNFNDLEIPVLRTPRSINISRPNNNNESTTTTTRNFRQSILPEITHDVFKLLKNIKHDLNNPLSIYKTTTISEAKQKLGLIKAYKQKTYEEILQLAKQTIE